MFEIENLPLVVNTVAPTWFDEYQKYADPAPNIPTAIVDTIAAGISTPVNPNIPASRMT
ncbi:hypothetical protein [Clostridium psychrophilum]|uniref:hypothetical protein n=1 Tax=Clostridium psychrophilum TaxID=132926 RepID=UPI001C0D6984|nr:hypothetical protein [Clostridium psychrophilum]MBU3182936.1 hypothetical protein [Clostridium psychrophilum]